MSDTPAGDGRDPEPGAGLRDRPLLWTVRLARCLRGAGVPCTPDDSLAATGALEHLDLADPLDVYFGLRSVFVGQPGETDAFDRCFWSLWGKRQGEGREAAAGADEAGTPPSREEREEEAGEHEPRRGDRPRGTSVTARLRTGDRRSPAEGREPDPEDAEARTALYSPRESLAARSFASLTRREVRELDRALDRLMVRLATRKSRRLRPRARRGKVDVRRSLRPALAHDGEIIRLARRARKVETPRVVLLCDVSGSMEDYSRFLVRFVLAAARERDVETFVFSTHLVHLTPWIAASRGLDAALEALSREVPGWSGGTRIGECLETFLEEYGRSMLGRRTVVVILSDGLDRGDIDALERAMRGIRRRARKVIWLNPLMESRDYAPEARGMKAALPWIDHLAPGHSLDALRELPRLIRL